MGLLLVASVLRVDILFSSDFESRGTVVQAKSAIVEELEEHLMGAAEQRAAALAQRCAADEAAELDPASAGVSAAL